MNGVSVPQALGFPSLKRVSSLLTPQAGLNEVMDVHGSFQSLSKGWRFQTPDTMWVCSHDSDRSTDHITPKVSAGYLAEAEVFAETASWDRCMKSSFSSVKAPVSQGWLEDI